MGRVKLNDYYQSTIPKTLRLPDGREFEVKALLDKSNQNRTNLKRDGSVIKKCASPRAPKYTNQETEWIINSTIKDIMLRYGCTVHKAHYIKNSVSAREGILIKSTQLPGS
jgi:hypothetical protein